MTEPIHDDEPDVGEPVARALLRAECPQWARARLEYLATSGTDHAMWRIRLDGGPDLVIRLPRRPGAASGVLREASVLRQLEATPLAAIATPRVRHVGRPHETFPHHWSVFEWIDGTDAWAARDALDARALDALADDLARAVAAIGELDVDEVAPRSPGQRGGPLRPLLERLHRWLDDPRWNASAHLDVRAARRLAREAEELVDEPVERRFVHGDLIPGNLLVDGGRLAAILDWGGAGRGDVAQDLAPAWAVLTAAERPAFRAALGVDDAAWIRGRTFELEHAIGGVVYYVPRRHPLGDVMARTLHRILDGS